MTHVAIDKTVHVYVQNKFLMNMDETVKGITKAEVIGFSGYKGEALTLQLLIDGGVFFSYMPLHSVNAYENGTFDYSMEELTYNNTKGGKIECVCYTRLMESTANTRLTKSKKLIKSKYLMTLDWVDTNDQMNIMVLENGQIAAQPNHKVLFDGNTVFPNYKKLRKDWIL